MQLVVDGGRHRNREEATDGDAARFIRMSEPPTTPVRRCPDQRGPAPASAGADISLLVL
jgi:hypothetical protein